uniref:Uncharacterized protein n=1 Tax=Arundo donax TaxID=35708 RepID=A0A0A9BEJ7_ARUDO
MIFLHVKGTKMCTLMEGYFLLYFIWSGILLLFCF